MPETTVQRIVQIIDAFAPFETAEDYDNVGLLVGDPSRKVSTVLCSLDVTIETVREAERLHAELIVSHHPLMFRGIRRLTAGNPEAEVLCALIRGGISLISAHTNWDQTDLSGSACVARAIGLTDLSQTGYLFTGRFPEPVSVRKAAEALKQAIHAPLRVYGSPDRMISVMSLAGGAYGEGYLEAIPCGAQAYLTGEIRHHEITDAAARGVVIFEAGHYASEAPMIPALVSFLRDKLGQEDPSCRIVSTSCVPFPGALDI